MDVWYEYVRKYSFEKVSMLTLSVVAFISLIGFSFTVVLAWKGHVIRQYSMQRFRQDEEGEALFSG